jgi:Ca2+-dependent lipid-binding protein
MSCLADNGLNPIWNESCEFEVKFPDIALIRFVVQDEDMFGDTNFIGQATYPVSIIWFINVLVATPSSQMYRSSLIVDQ